MTPGQAEAADGGGAATRRSSLGLQSMRDAVGAQQRQRSDVVAQRAGPVVVLAVHVVGDGAADRDEAGARASPAGTSRAAATRGDDLVEQHAGLALEHARVAASKAMKRSRPRVSQQLARRVQAGVAVAAAVAVGQNRTRDRARGGSVESGRATAPRGAAGSTAAPTTRLGQCTPDQRRHCSHVGAHRATRERQREQHAADQADRSRTANTTGSSCMWPRWACIHMRLIQ